MAIGSNFWKVLVLLFSLLFSGFSSATESVDFIAAEVVQETAVAQVVDVDAAWTLINDAQMAYWENDLETAIALLRQAGTAQDAQVQTVCVNGLWQFGDLEGAEPILRALIDADDAYSLLRYDLAGLLLEMGRAQEARAIMDEALALHPGDEESMYRYANTIYMYMDGPEAMETIEALIQDHPEMSDLYAFKSWLLAETWDYAAALEAAQHALTMAKAQNVDLSWYYWQQYMVEKQMGSFDQALKTINRALSPGDDLYNYLERVDLNLWYRHDLPAALEDLDALALKHGNDPDVLYLRMLANLRLEAFVEARQDVEAMALEGAAEQLMKGICALYEENLLQAVTCLDAALALEPDNPGALLYRTLAALLLEDDAQSALALADRTIAIAPDNMSAYRLKGNALEALGQWTLAEEAYRQGIDLAEDDASCLASLVTLLMNWNRMEDARAAMARMDAQYPDWEETLGMHVTMDFWLDQAYDAALDGLKRYQQRFVSLAEQTTSFEAQLLAALGEREAALALFDAVLEAPDVDAYVAHAYGLLHLGEYEQAAQALEAGAALLAETQQSPASQRADTLLLLVNGAELAAVQGDVDAALARLEQACALGWKPVMAYMDFELAAVLETEGFQSLLEQYPVE